MLGEDVNVGQHLRTDAVTFVVLLQRARQPPWLRAKPSGAEEGMLIGVPGSPRHEDDIKRRLLSVHGVTVWQQYDKSLA